MDSNQHRHSAKAPVNQPNTRSLIIMICAAIVIAIGIVGVLYVGNHAGMRSMPMAQSQNR